MGCPQRKPTPTCDCSELHYDEHLRDRAETASGQAAAGIPLTLYGGGQTRGFLNLEDTCSAWSWRCARQRKLVICASSISSTELSV